MLEISCGFNDGEGDGVMIIGAVNEGLVWWWRTDEVSGEREEMLKGERKRMFEIWECRIVEMMGGVRKLIKELAPNINRTC